MIFLYCLSVCFLSNSLVCVLDISGCDAPLSIFGQLSPKIGKITYQTTNLPQKCTLLSQKLLIFLPSVTPVLVLSHSVSEFACHISGCSAVHSTLEEYEHHYNSLHRHVCCSCRRPLPTARLLDIHIQEWHDSLFTILAQRQDMVS